jgi:hypothetical protein
MAALIEYLCTASHERRSDPAITLEQRAWAFCAAGASEGHQWSRIDPTTVESLRLRSGNGKPLLVPDESDAHGEHDEHSATSRLAR